MRSWSKVFNPAGSGSRAPSRTRPGRGVFRQHSNPMQRRLRDPRCRVLEAPSPATRNCQQQLVVVPPVIAAIRESVPRAITRGGGVESAPRRRRSPRHSRWRRPAALASARPSLEILAPRAARACATASPSRTLGAGSGNRTGRQRPTSARHSVTSPARRRRRRCARSHRAPPAGRRFAGARVEASFHPRRSRPRSTARGCG